LTAFDAFTLFAQLSADLRFTIAICTAIVLLLNLFAFDALQGDGIALALTDA